MRSMLAFIFLFYLTLTVASQTSEKTIPVSGGPSATPLIRTSDTDSESKIPKSRSEVPPEKSRPVKIPKLGVEKQITVDGLVDEESWNTAAVFKDFVQTFPGDNIESSKKTEAYVMYDEKHLYLAFKCWDDRDKIRATVAKRDNVFGEDNVRVWLDTYFDRRRAYILGFNPLGIQQDGIFTEGRGADFSVDIVMESKGVIQAWGWSVEVKIPFKSLRYQAGKGKYWGFNVARNIDRLNDEFDSWMPDDRNLQGFLIKHGRITGFDEIKSERTLELNPSVTFSETGRRVPSFEVAAGRFVNESIKQEYGLNLKYTITPNITLDAAINPDYAEIEADAPVITANQRFPIFFNEKRPFFLEGADTFDSPIRVFHSRSIIDPDYAAKLTGKIGKNSFGFLVASDNAPGNFDIDSRNDPEVRPFIDEFIDRNALFAVARVKRDIGSEHSMGFFGTARVFPERRNFVGGFDGRFKVNPTSIFTFQAVASHTRSCFFESDFDDAGNPGQALENGTICGGGVVNGVQELGDIYSRYRTGNGVAFESFYGIFKETFGLDVGIEGRSKDYRSDAGFNQRTNTSSAFVGIRKSTKSNPTAAIIRTNIFNNVNIRFDWDGRLQSLAYNSSLNVSLQKNSMFNIWGGVEKEVLYEEEFGLKRNEHRGGAFFGDPKRSATQPYFGGFFRTQPHKKIAASANVNFVWNSFDFDFGAGNRFPRVSAAALADPASPLDPGPGRKIFIQASLELAPTDPFKISLNYMKNILVRNDTGETAFDVNIYSLRSTYQFSRFVFARVRMDYDTLRSNVNGQYLFGWNPSPGTALYVGYNDDFNYSGFNPYTGDHEPGIERNSRTFFIRMSYLFRKSF